MIGPKLRGEDYLQKSPDVADEPTHGWRTKDIAASSMSPYD